MNLYYSLIMFSFELYIYDIYLNYVFIIICSLVCVLIMYMWIMCLLCVFVFIVCEMNLDFGLFFELFVICIPPCSLPCFYSFVIFLSFSLIADLIWLIRLFFYVYMIFLGLLIFKLFHSIYIFPLYLHVVGLNNNVKFLCVYHC